MVKTLDRTIGAAEKLAKKSAKTFLKDNPNLSKEEIFQQAFISGMATGIEMLTYKEQEK